MTWPSDRAERHVVLRTPRMVVTTWILADVDALHELHSDAETMKFVRSGLPESRDDVERLVGSYIAQQSAAGWTKWRVADLDGQLVGRAGFGGDDKVRGVSYLISRSLWGQGLATEAAAALVEWHRSNAADAQLRGLVAVGNDASIRVLEKVGFQRQGTEDYEGTLCWNYAFPTPG